MLELLKSKTVWSGIAIAVAGLITAQHTNGALSGTDILQAIGTVGAGIGVKHAIVKSGK